MLDARVCTQLVALCTTHTDTFQQTGLAHPYTVEMLGTPTGHRLEAAGSGTARASSGKVWALLGAGDMKFNADRDLAEVRTCR